MYVLKTVLSNIYCNIQNIISFICTNSIFIIHLITYSILLVLCKELLAVLYGKWIVGKVKFTLCDKVFYVRSLSLPV
jgi:hypothetical protein